MTEEELCRAIEAPARKVGLTTPAELVSRMIEDVKDSPGSLPLLQYALTELWSQRDGVKLLQEAYSRMGGVKGALARRAEEVYDSFSEEERKIAKRIFIHLTQLGEGAEDTRRQVTKQSLILAPETEAVVDGVIQKLADANLQPGRPTLRRPALYFIDFTPGKKLINA